MSPRCDEIAHSAGRQAGRRDRRAGRLERPARRAAARRRDRPGRRRHHLLHLRHHRKAQGRAGHPAQRQLQHHGRRLRRRPAPSCAGARRRPRPTRTRRSAAMLLSVPFFHVTGCFAILNPTLAGGAKLVMMRKWDPMRAFELIEREKSQPRRRRADHRLAADRASAARQLRPVVAGERRLRRRALGAGAGAQDHGDLPQVASPATAGA